MQPLRDIHIYLPLLALLAGHALAQATHMPCTFMGKEFAHGHRLPEEIQPSSRDNCMRECTCLDGKIHCKPLCPPDPLPADLNCLPENMVKSDPSEEDCCTRWACLQEDYELVSFEVKPLNSSFVEVDFELPRFALNHKGHMEVNYTGIPTAKSFDLEAPPEGAQWIRKTNFRTQDGFFYNPKVKFLLGNLRAGFTYWLKLQVHFHDAQAPMDTPLESQLFKVSMPDATGLLLESAYTPSFTAHYFTTTQSSSNVQTLPGVERGSLDSLLSSSFSNSPAPPTTTTTTTSAPPTRILQPVQSHTTLQVLLPTTSSTTTTTTTTTEAPSTTTTTTSPPTTTSSTTTTTAAPTTSTSTTTATPTRILQPVHSHSTVQVAVPFSSSATMTTTTEVPKVSSSTTTTTAPTTSSTTTTTTTTTPTSTTTTASTTSTTTTTTTPSTTTNERVQSKTTVINTSNPTTILTPFSSSHLPVIEKAIPKEDLLNENSLPPCSRKTSSETILNDIDSRVSLPWTEQFQSHLNAPLQRYAWHLLVALSIMTILFTVVTYLYLKKSTSFIPITSQAAYDNPTFAKFSAYYVDQPHVKLVDENHQNFHNDAIIARINQSHRHKNQEADKTSPLHQPPSHFQMDDVYDQNNRLI